MIYAALIELHRDHMMDQTHIGYYYWQQPMANTSVDHHRDIEFFTHEDH